MGIPDMRVRIPIQIVIFALFSWTSTAQTTLTDEQVTKAIALGKSGNVPAVHVGTSRDFEVFIEGPVAHIAALAATASKQFRSFEPNDVTAALRRPNYVVTVLSTNNGRYVSPSHIALQPTDARAPGGVVQPLAEDGDVDSVLVGREATFDHLPDGAFDIVVVTLGGNQQFSVTAKDRAQIQ